MARTIGGMILGYLVMALIVFCSLTAVYLAMGADAAFRPGTYDVSGLWMAVSFVLGFVAAVAGGWVCAAVARNVRAATILAVVVLLLGIAVAIPTLTATPAPKVRLGDVPNVEAMMGAQTPAWIAFLNPLVGAAGVMIGGRLRGSRP